jgi:hypothetical protein
MNLPSPHHTACSQLPAIQPRTSISGSRTFRALLCDTMQLCHHVVPTASGKQDHVVARAGHALVPQAKVTISDINIQHLQCLRPDLLKHTPEYNQRMAKSLQPIFSKRCRSPPRLEDEAVATENYFPSTFPILCPRNSPSTHSPEPLTISSIHIYS